MRLLRNTAIYAGLIVLVVGCKKEEAPDPAPVLEFVGISATEVVEFSNALTVTINYSDVNGDLGSPDPDENTVRVRDARLPDYDWYHLQPLTPNLEELNISGSFVLELNPLFILGNGVEEVTTFTVQVRDRAGNWSNEVVTPQVRIMEEE